MSEADLVDDLLRRMRNLESKFAFAQKRARALGITWQLENGNAKQFVHDDVPDGLKTLRNAIAHGTRVPPAHLRLEDVAFFRRTSCQHLEEVYRSFGDAAPPWMR